MGDTRSALRSNIMQMHAHAQKDDPKVRATLEAVMQKLEEALRLSKHKEEEACKRG